MKKVKIIVLMMLLFNIHDTKPMLNGIDLCAVWIGCSYLYRITKYWIDAQHINKHQITIEDVKKIMALLQLNQFDIQECKKMEKELYRKIDELAKKIRDQQLQTINETVYEII